MQGLRIGGHPLHPALVHFPVAFWTAAPLLDLGWLLTQAPAWWQAAFWCNALGVALAVPAMCAGLMDLMALAADHRAQATAQRHMLLMGTAWCAYVGVLLFQRPGRMPGLTEAWGVFGLSVAGFLLLGLGAYQGARLVYDFGVGQNRALRP